MPGVFFTPAPGRRLQQQQQQQRSGLHADPAVLLAIIDATVSEAQAAMRLAASAGIASGCQVLHVEIERLSNSIFHLNRSNIEILEFDPDDPELRQAVDENVIVIKNQQLRIAVLYEMIQHIAAGHPAESFPVPDAAALARLAAAQQQQGHSSAAAPAAPAPADPPVEHASPAAPSSTTTSEAQSEDAGMWL